MYLKRLEAVGFKSFADKTVLDFEKGLTCIVGPNGCGKSNISDAVRWVLGEQSAKALRGQKMEDIIFNGTDKRKALSMAEVSLVFGDCEATLGMEYNEVTISRRVFRSGEGQYFINKAPCRLKDIARLFMDTGIGTNAYSILEQGKIDQILSSRPDDRRAVFEEASGITKYKTDKREALRKLDHTEANLLRLEDIIREVKRQIISLQRQAGKARRYKALKDELRAYDLFVAKNRIKETDVQLQKLEAELKEVSSIYEDAEGSTTRIEEQVTSARGQLSELEQQLSRAMEELSQSQSQAENAKQSITLNQERIQEFQNYANRDVRAKAEAEEKKQQLNQEQQRLSETLEQLREDKEKAAQNLVQQQEELERKDQNIETLRGNISKGRTNTVQLENDITRLQQELNDVAAKERATLLRRERLSVEHEEADRAATKLGSRLDELRTLTQNIAEQVDTKRREVEQLKQSEDERQNSLKELSQSLHEAERDLSSHKATLALLQQQQEQHEGFPQGAQWLLEEAEKEQMPVAILGTLAKHFTAEKPYERALQSALRHWLDAIVVTDHQHLKQVMQFLDDKKIGGARLLSANIASTISTPAPQSEHRLLKHISFAPEFEALAERLLGSYILVENLNDIPADLSNNQYHFITRSGHILRTDGSAEYWSETDDSSNPLAQQQLISKTNEAISKLEQSITSYEAERNNLSTQREAQAEQLKKAEQELALAQQELAEHSGELKHLERESGIVSERVQTVQTELESIVSQATSGTNQQASMKHEIETRKNKLADLRAELTQHTEQLQQHEQERHQQLERVTDFRLQAAEARQQFEHIERQRGAVNERILELDAVINDREQEVLAYKNRAENLKEAIEQATGNIPELERVFNEKQQAISNIRNKRSEMLTSLETAEQDLKGKRSLLDEKRNQKQKIEIELARIRVTHENLLQRLDEEYQITVEELARTEDPEWDTETAPTLSELDERIAEIKAKIEKLGAVNLVAIEEHQELEDRYQFLLNQQKDLLDAKEKLLEMIKKINETTTEMFKSTFDKVNTNFQEMFKKLFGGGHAKLVLLDEGEVLDSGIDIIARPPGKNYKPFPYSQAESEP